MEEDIKFFVGLDVHKDTMKSAVRRRSAESVPRGTVRTSNAAWRAILPRNYRVNC